MYVDVKGEECLTILGGIARLKVQRWMEKGVRNVLKVYEWYKSDKEGTKRVCVKNMKC